MRTLQVAEVRETQPDCRLYIAITKCDPAGGDTQRSRAGRRGVGLLQQPQW